MTRPPIPRPERFTPEAIVVKLPRWRVHADGSGETYDETTGAWGKIHPILVRALESLRDGLGFEETYARALLSAGELKPNHVRGYLRRYFLQLEKRGHIRLPFEAPPAVFDGRYRRIRELGRGGAGVAHLCHDERTDTVVVVKHAWGYLSPIDRADDVIRRESAVMQRFEHPGIVAWLGAFEHDGLHHMVRGYADGAPIPDAYARSGVLPVEARRAFAHAAADALAHVHERGHLFLDFTPGNLVIREDGSPLILDVGVCRPLVDGRVKLNGSTGSRGYAAPEIMDHREATPRSDVFSFGCFLHYLATGRTPGHRWGTPERRAALVEAGVPAAERDLILSLCADDPAARPADLRAVQALLV